MRRQAQKATQIVIIMQLISLIEIVCVEILHTKSLFELLA